MHRFVTLFHELDCTASEEKKVMSLVKYFNAADDHDVLWTIALFMGKRPKRTVSLSLLQEWYAETTEIPQWLYEQSLDIIGDLTETISILLPESDEDSTYSLSEVIKTIKSIANAADEAKKLTTIEVWKGLGRDAKFLFNKILTGGFRMNLPSGIIVKALSAHLGESEATISHRLNGNWTADTTTFKELLIDSDNTEALSKPYPFYLASTLDKEPKELGSPSEWAAEYKWDGIRGQIIKRNGALFVWNRKKELVTQKFPEFSIIKDRGDDDFVIDGEIIAMREGKPLPFADLQKRVNRKTIGKKLLEEIPVAFMAYDLLEYGKDDVRNLIYKERRKRLKTLVSKFSAEAFLSFSEEIPFKKWNELRTFRDNARSKGAEGLMIKKVESEYREGRKEGDWWKWKVDPLSIDAVLLYATRGDGGRNGPLTDFTFAVKNEEQWTPFTKAFGGLEEDELSEIRQFVKDNTVESFGPVRSVTPQLVFELTFEGISRSSRHKSGVVLRLPSIKSWRKDKSIEEANTLEDLLGFLEVYDRV